uniref:Uncharacterized protein n=1 Tax=Sinocyclocheilus rhinocerous TaxID=307959 RepID=A0A673J6N4_9TELE
LLGASVILFCLLQLDMLVNLVYIRLGDKECEFNSGFRLLLHTSQPSLPPGAAGPDHTYKLHSVPRWPRGTDTGTGGHA